MKFNSILRSLKNYEAGKPIELVVRDYGIEQSNIIKLASNENPYGCSPKVNEAVASSVNKMSLYPDDSMYLLKESLAENFHVKQKNIIIGAGSDQVIEFATHAKLDSESKVLMNGVTFAMYEIYSKLRGAQIIRTTSEHHDMEQFHALYKEHKPEIVFLCAPNNPTGDALGRDEIYNFIKQVDSQTLVIVDGAYMEYAAYKSEAKKIEPSDIIEKFNNVLYLGTFSKAYGLGGMRIGYGVASSEIIEVLHKLRPPFNITTLSLVAALEALKDQEFVNRSVVENFKQMRRYEEFAKIEEIEIIESFTNFITFKLSTEYNAKKLSEELLRKGIIIRDLSGYGMNAIRITIGTQEQNSVFLNIFKELLR